MDKHHVHEMAMHMVSAVESRYGGHTDTDCFELACLSIAASIFLGRAGRRPDLGELTDVMVAMQAAAVSALEEIRITGRHHPGMPTSHRGRSKPRTWGVDHDH